MIKNSFFLHLIYISLSNDMSGNLNSLDEKQIKSDNSVSKIEGGGGAFDHHVMIKNIFFYLKKSLSNDIFGNLAFIK